MATGTIILPMVGATPDGTVPPAMTIEGGSFAAVTFWHWLFDDTADEKLFWTFRMPADYASGLLGKVLYKMASATADDVVLSISIAAVTPNNGEAAEGSIFHTQNTFTDTVPGSAGDLAEGPITISNDDGVVAGDLVTAMFMREGGSGNDDATGDLELCALSLEYTQT